MEDVQYMLRQGASVEQSFLFIVDSAMRDHVAYPTPSNYYIPFPQAFRNVFAVDLADATVPRTEYTIDTHNNTLSYAPGSWASYDQARLAGEAVTVTLQPGDYNVAQLIEALNGILNDAGLARDHLPLRVESVGDPVDITNKIRFARSQPFVLFMNASTMRKSIGFGNPAHAPGATVNWDGSARFSTDASVANDIFISVPVSTESPTLMFAGPVPVELLDYSVAMNSTTTKVRQEFTAAASGDLTSVILRGASPSNTSLLVEIHQDATLVDSCTVTASPDVLIWDGTFAASAPVLAETQYTMTISFAGAISDLSLYRGETFSDDVVNAIQTYDGSAWVTSSTIDALCADLSVNIAGHSVEPPGQCNLTGERYVLIKSPDIEQYLHRDRAAAFDSMSPGLGMMKLVGMGYREERYNFLSYSTRKFHPIGKLKGITIRLETRDGRLYDSHGIDHTLLLCVKMYGPGSSTATPVDLYPGYTPDMRQALVRKLERERC